MGTAPYKINSDGAGRIDGLEVHGGDPGAIGPTTPTDPLNPDSDGNGQKDGQEVFQGTDPNDPLSRMPAFGTVGLAALLIALGLANLVQVGRAESR